jgi:hypothetical protein
MMSRSAGVESRVQVLRAGNTDSVHVDPRLIIPALVATGRELAPMAPRTAHDVAAQLTEIES